MSTWFLALAACLVTQAPPSNADEAAYSKSLEKRAEDILGELRLKDQAVAGRVRETIIGQYRGLRALHDARDSKVAVIQADGDLEKAAKAVRIEAERDSTRRASTTLNDQFLAQLAGDLTADQVDAVKDKMTYHKLQITYNGYIEMLPRLTEKQRRAIFQMLKQARDEAVYAGSAEEKTAIFGRYKGKVNNYLSSEGHDLKLASKEWAERRKAGK